jgi:hypothetical protein
MTIDRAVEILNERRHDDRNDWLEGRMISMREGFAFFAYNSGEDGRHLKEFEAVAIAEKYEREDDDAGDSPSPSW